MSQLTSIRTLYEQLRELSEKAGIPEDEPRASTPHTYSGIQEELNNLSLALSNLSHRTEAAESDLSKTRQELQQTQIALSQERLDNYRRRKH